MKKPPFGRIPPAIPSIAKPAGVTLETVVPIGGTNAWVDPRTAATSGPQWARVGTHVWAPDVAEAWRRKLASYLNNNPQNLSARNSLINELLVGLSNFFLALNVNPQASPAYAQPFSAAFGVAPTTETIVGTNGGLAILATAAESGLRGPSIIYPVPAGLRADGSFFRNPFARNPLMGGTPCATDDGRCVYTVAPTTAVPSPQMTIEFLKSVVDRLDDHTLLELVTQSGNRAIQAEPTGAPPNLPVGFGNGDSGGGGGGVVDQIRCNPPQVTSEAEAATWNRNNPSCPPVVYVPGNTPSCTYNGQPVRNQAQIDAWNHANPSCRIPDLQACVPPQEMTTEFEREAWRLTHRWCAEDAMFRPLEVRREEPSSSGSGLWLMLAAGAAVLYAVSTAGKK